MYILYTFSVIRMHIQKHCAATYLTISIAALFEDRPSFWLRSKIHRTSIRLQTVQTISQIINRLKNVGNCFKNRFQRISSSTASVVFVGFFGLPPSAQTAAHAAANATGDPRSSEGFDRSWWLSLPCRNSPHFLMRFIENCGPTLKFYLKVSDLIFC